LGVDSLENLEDLFVGPAVERALSVPMAEVTAECISESVAAVTRAAKVEAFSS